MTGQSLLNGRLKLFLHGSYENYVGQQVTERQFLTHSGAPQPFDVYRSDEPRPDHRRREIVAPWIHLAPRFLMV